MSLVLIIIGLISRSAPAEPGSGLWPWQALCHWVTAEDSWSLPDSQQLLVFKILYGILGKLSCAGPSVSLKDSLGRICH